MKPWKLPFLVLVVSFVWVVESPAGPRCRRGTFSSSYPAVPVMPRAEDTVDLRWKFEANKPFYVEISTKTDQTIKVTGIDVEQKQIQTFILRVTPERKDEKGNRVLAVKVMGLRMSLDIGGNKIDYDSRKPQPNNPLWDFFKALKDFKFKMILAPNMDISRVEGAKEFIAERGKTNPQMEPLLKSILSESAFKKMFEPVFPAIPQKPLRKGETWSRVNFWDLGAIGMVQMKTKYAYQGKEKELERIKVENRGSVMFPGGGGALGTPEKTLPGEILFDRSRGRVVRASLPFRLEGTMKVDIGGMMIAVSLKQTVASTVIITDSNPVSAKPK